MKKIPKLNFKIFEKNSNIIKYGTFTGVFLPSILTMLGVILYLRMGWCLANAGVIGIISIILISCSITFLTGLSISATATNMQIKGGGAYFMISRSFGLEIGAAIGLPLYLAQTLGISFYISGFTETIFQLFPNLSPQLIGLSVLSILTLLTIFSTDVTLKIQFFIFILVVLSIISFLIGKPISTPVEHIIMQPKTGFWKVFAVFFPAVTGIEAGIALSSDLKDSKKSIPLGILSSIIIGFIVYVVIVLKLHKYATNNELLSNPLIFKDISKYKPLFFIGIWGATISSALSNLISAPRTLLALSNDRVLPSILSYRYKSNPIFSTLITFIIAASGIYFGNLNIVAPILSMFFLTSYGMLNVIAGFESLIASPVWRPTFKIPWYISFIGALSCFIAMFMINAGTSFIAIFACIIIYLFMQKRNLHASWSNMKRAILLFFTRHSIYNLYKSTDNIRSWLPNILVLSGVPTARWHLIDFANIITGNNGIMTILTIIKNPLALDDDIQPKDSFITQEGRILEREKYIKDFLLKKNVNSLVKVCYSSNLLEPIKSLLLYYGIGNIKPNIIILGDTEDNQKMKDYCNILKTIHELNKNILILDNSKIDISSQEMKQNKNPKLGFIDTISSNSKNPFKKSKKAIDIWWGCKSNNASLMLVTAYLMQKNQKWMDSVITLKAIARNEEEKKSMSKSLIQFIKQIRIEANVKVYLNEEDSSCDGESNSHFLLIQKNSKDSDIVFLGMKSPSLTTNITEYIEYYDNIKKNTSGLSQTILALSGTNSQMKNMFD